jgi:protein TonB
MFEGSLTESSRTRTRRSPATVIVSVVVHVVLVGIAILTPLIYTQALPGPGLFGVLPMLPPRDAAPKAEPVELITETSIPEMSIEIDRFAMVAPSVIPEEVAAIVDRTDDTVRSGLRPVPGILPGDGLSGVIRSLNPGVDRTSPPPPLPLPSPPPIPELPRPLRLSQGAVEGNAIHQVQPEYPRLARSARIEGVVLLEGTIAKDGTIQNLRVITGHALLTQAAVNAIEQWVYEPFLLNGRPIEIVTTFTLTFSMN